MKSSDTKWLLAWGILLAATVWFFCLWYEWKHVRGWFIIDAVLLFFVGIVFLKYLVTPNVGSTPVMESAPFNFRRVIIWIGRLVLGGIFVYAGFSKLLMPNNAHLWPMFFLKFSISMNLSSFAQQVESYKMISPEASQLVAHTLPFVEIVLGLLLLVGWRLRIWATAITAIMVGFLAVVTRAYLLHMDINCGCFGTPEKLTGMTIVRDGALVALALLMTIFAFLEARKPHPWTAPEKA